MTSLPKLLAIETATSNCSVALQFNGEALERSESGSNIHSQVLLKMVQEVLLEAELETSNLDGVGVGQGPGSFTGLRIGIGVAQGIAYGAGCPMLGVSSLAALAAQAQVNGVVLAAIDARMGEAYWAVFKSASNRAVEVELIGEIQVSAPEFVNAQVLREMGVDINKEDVFLVGNAWSEYKDHFDLALVDQTKFLKGCEVPEAKGILTLASQAYIRGETESPIDFTPEYVRNNVAVKKGSG